MLVSWTTTGDQVALTGDRGDERRLGMNSHGSPVSSSLAGSTVSSSSADTL